MLNTISFLHCCSHSFCATGKGSSDFFQDTWVFSFAVEEWHQVNITEDSDIPEARGFAAGGASDDDGMDDTMMLWISMGTNKVKRKLSDTWTLSVNFSNPFQGTMQFHVVCLLSNLMFD